MYGNEAAAAWWSYYSVCVCVIRPPLDEHVGPHPAVQRRNSNPTPRNCNSWKLLEHLDDATACALVYCTVNFTTWYLDFIWLHIGLHFHEKKKKKRKGLNHNQCISPHPPCSIYNVIYIKQTKKMMMTTKLNKCSARRCHPSYWKILIDVKGDQFDTHFWFYSSYLSVFFYLIYLFIYFF